MALTWRPDDTAHGNTMTNATTPPPRQSYHHGNLREEMIRCGREILATEGVHGLTLRSAARLAGVSHGAPRNQFADKEGLLAAIAADGFRELVAIRRARMSADMTAEGRLLTVMDGYIEFAVRHPALFYLMFGPQIVGKGIRRRGARFALRPVGALGGTDVGYLHVLALVRDRSARRAAIGSCRLRHP